MSETLVSSSQPETKRPWWKRLLRLFFWLCGGFVFILVLAVALTFVFEDKIKGFVLNKVNQYLNTTIYVDTEKDVRLTVIRTFPQVSVEFNNISALDATSNDKRDTLFQAKRIDLRFNILDFFKRNYTIRHIAVDEAVLDLRTDLKGNDNYHFIKTDTSTSAASTDVAFALEKFEFNDVKLRWRDMRDKSDYEITISTSELAGDFGSKNYTLASKAEFVVGKLKQGKAEWFAGNSGSFQVDLNIDNTTKLYRINTCSVNISDLKMKVTGDITDSNRGYLIKLAAKGDDVAIRDALSLLPASYAKDIEGISSTGDFFVDATINGIYNDSLLPEVEAKFGVYKGATLTRAGTPLKLENIAVDGTFSTAKEHSGLHITTFQAQTRTSKFSGSFDLTNLDRPVIRTKIDGHIDLSELVHLLQPDTIQEASGTLDVHLETSGKLGKSIVFSTTSLKEFQTSGEVRLMQSRLKLKNALLPIDSINGQLLFDGNNVTMRGMRARSGASDFKMEGALHNLLAWLLVEKAVLDVDADFRANTIDFNSLLGTSSSTAGDTTYKLVFPDRVQLRMHTQVGRLMFRQFEAADLSGDLVLRNRRLVADPIHIRTMGGEIIGSGMIDGTSIDSLLVTGNAKLNNVNVTKMFVQMENFGQDVMTEKNIKGTLTADVNFVSLWGADLGVNEKRIYALADIELERGELNEFAPLDILAKFIRLDDLKHLKFNTLKNRIEIKNRLIDIPAMDIESNAVDLTMWGTHNFDNYVDYHFRIELDEVHARKVIFNKKENEEFGEVEEDGGRRMSLYVSMKGPLDNPEVKYFNVKDAIKNLKKDLKQEKQNLKTILREEFGLFKKDTTLNANGSDKKNGDDGKFIIRWNEQGTKKEEELEGDDF